MLTLYGHPFSSYCQKVITALYENNTPFELRLIDFGNPDDTALLEELWPLKRFPILVDHETKMIESSIIIEYLEGRHPGPVMLLPTGRDAALDVRFMDRFFDNYVMTPMMRIVFDAIRQPADRDPAGVVDAKRLLDTSYRWLEARMAGREWACGKGFTMADCAAAPSLFYADWVHPIGEEHPLLRSYRARLMQRHSFARAVDEARPYRHLFPLGAPNRD